jgi:putative endonuclease
MPREFYVYILARDSRELYVGVTGDLARRISQHRSDFHPTGYTANHGTKRLVYCEITEDVKAAIRRNDLAEGW